MKRIIPVVLLLLSLAGCRCTTCPEYRGLLRQVGDNLRNDIGPKYKGYLDADAARPEDLRANDYAVVEDTLAAIDRVMTAHEGESEGGSE